MHALPCAMLRQLNATRLCDANSNQAQRAQLLNVRKRDEHPQAAHLTCATQRQNTRIIRQLLTGVRRS